MIFFQSLSLSLSRSLSFSLFFTSKGFRVNKNEEDKKKRRRNGSYPRRVNEPENLFFLLYSSTDAPLLNIPRWYRRMLYLNWGLSLPPSPNNRLEIKLEPVLNKSENPNIKKNQ